MDQKKLYSLLKSILEISDEIGDHEDKKMFEMTSFLVCPRNVFLAGSITRKFSLLPWKAPP